MSLIGNIIWFIIGGLWLGLAWTLLGVLLCMTLIGIPLGLQCFKAAAFTFAPFGKEIYTDFYAHPIANVIWIVVAGWELALGYLIYGVACCITLIGIPAGLQLFKFAKLALIPFGAKIN